MTISSLSNGHPSDLALLLASVQKAHCIRKAVRDGLLSSCRFALSVLTALTFLVCGAPAFASVTVSSPAANSTVTSPVQYTATATAPTCAAGVAAVGIYVNNTLAYKVNGSSLSTSLTLSPGNYSTVVQEWDNCGGVTTTSVPIVVSNGVQNGVTVTAPLAGSTVQSPVQFTASAGTTSCASGIAAIGIYVANTLEYKVSATTLSTQLSLPAGAQQTVVQAWDNCGGVIKQPVNFTVGSASATTVTMTASPASITAGSSSVLMVNAANATSVVVNGSDGSSYSLALTGGSQTVKPNATVSYTATATGASSTATATATVTVAAGTSAVSVSVPASPFAQGETVQVNVSASCTSSCSSATILVDGSVAFSMPLGSSGSASAFGLSASAVGQHTIQAESMDASGNILATSSAVPFNVVTNNLPVPTASVIFQPVFPISGQNNTLSVALSCGSACGSGGGYLSIDNVNVGYVALNTSGVASGTYAASGLQWTVGKHTVSFSFFGNAQYSDVVLGPVPFTVIPPYAQQPMTISVSVPNSPFPQAETVDVQTVINCPTTCPGSDGYWIDGVYSFGSGVNTTGTHGGGALGNVPVGQHTIQATYGDAAGNIAESPVANFTVVPNNLPVPTGTFTLSPATPVPGESATVNIALSCGSSCGTGTGYLFIDNVYAGTIATDSSGLGSRSYLVSGSQWASGNHSMTFSFFGNAQYSDALFGPFSFTVAGTPGDIYDNGTVSLTVGSVTETVPYGEAQNSLSTTLASALQTAIANDSAAPVTASLSGTTLTLTAKSQSSGTIAFSLLDSYDTVDFTSPSFTFTPSAGTLTAESTGSGTPGVVYQYIITPDGGPSGYGPNGNLVSYTDSANGSWTFGYDNLNRLTSSQTSSPAAGLYSFGCWAYDSFGNRLAQATSSQAFPASPSSPCQAAPSATFTLNSSFYSANNQITSTTASGMPVQPTYDQAGNIINDGVNKYLYDAEGRLCAEESFPLSGGGIMTQYLYNAKGQRVAKGTISNMSCDPIIGRFTLTAQYLLGPNGEQVTEIAPGGTAVHTNVYAAGSLIASYNPETLTPHYLLSDWLGTRRAQTDSSGALEATYTSYPFGDQPQAHPLTASAVDPTEQHFTGKERDAESGLDNFGARYFGSNMGRFMSPDGFSDGSDFDNPQSWNLYSYVQNKPLTSIDPDGHDCLLQSRTDDNHVSLIRIPGDCGTVTTGSGQSKTYVPGTITGYSMNGNSLDIGYDSYDGQSSGVVNTKNAPAFDFPGIDGPANAAIFGQIGNGGMQSIGVFTVGSVAIGGTLGLAGVPTAVLGAEGGSLAGVGRSGAAVANRLWHLFGKPEHGLGALVAKYGSELAAYSAILNAAQAQITATGNFVGVTIQVGGMAIQVNGTVINNVLTVSTAYVPK